MSDIELRPLQESDAENILTWVNNPEVVGHIAAFSGAPFTLKQEQRYVQKMRASSQDYVFSIFRKDGAYLGQVGLHGVFPMNRIARLAIVIGDKSDFGKGYGSAAIRLALDKAFGELELHKIWLLVMFTNKRSRSLYRHLGFIEEGILRQEYFHKGEFHDMVRMSILENEWPRKPAEVPKTSGKVSSPRWVFTSING